MWAALEREGALVVTKDGVPRSIMVPTSDATLLEDVQEILRFRERVAGQCSFGISSWGTVAWRMRRRFHV